MAETDDFLSGIGLSEADIAQPTNVYERFILELANNCSTVQHDFFEIHENYSNETLALGESIGWKGELKKDLQGKARMIVFTK